MKKCEYINKEGYCPLAVKQLKNRDLINVRDFTKIQGCCFAIREQFYDYCFFKYIMENQEEHSISRISLLLQLPEPVVKELIDSTHAIISEYLK